ncbi:MAG TPA: glycosyltransferase [Candidatus Magasanikbacteria bacterium]|nr:glycosyltransferase [Candidatus Magasanikbacteria bacterium]
MPHTRKKILIVSLSAGSGHIQTAKALERNALLNFPQLQCRHIDIADYITPLLKKTTVEGYDFLVSHLPKVWSGLFRISDNKAFIKTYHAFTDYLKMLNSFEFLHEVEKFNPDHIVTTHFLPSEILVHAMKKRSKAVPITQIITDYSVHPIMVVKGISEYVVSTSEMKEELIHTYKVSPAHIHQFGIPIDPVFYGTQSLEHIQLKYHLPHNKPLILLLSGGSGLMELTDIIEELFDKLTIPFTLVAVTGKNKKMFNRISKLAPPKYISYVPLGWTDDISSLMKLASVVVSKPGGLTTTECTVSQVPLIAIHPIPGQEDFNIEYLKKNHLGDHAKTPTDIIPLITKYLSHSQVKKDCTQVQSGTQLLEFITKLKS